MEEKELLHLISSLEQDIAEEEAIVQHQRRIVAWLREMWLNKYSEQGR